MPELAEVEAVRRQIDRKLKKKKIKEVGGRTTAWVPGWQK